MCLSSAHSLLVTQHWKIIPESWRLTHATCINSLSLPSVSLARGSGSPARASEKSFVSSHLAKPRKSCNQHLYEKNNNLLARVLQSLMFQSKYTCWSKPMTKAVAVYCVSAEIKLWNEYFASRNHGGDDRYPRNWIYVIRLLVPHLSFVWKDKQE